SEPHYVNQAGGTAHHDTGHRERPTRARNIAALDRSRKRKRQAGTDRNADLDIPGKAIRPAVACLHHGLPAYHFFGVTARLVALDAELRRDSAANSSPCGEGGWGRRGAPQQSLRHDPPDPPPAETASTRVSAT